MGSSQSTNTKAPVQTIENVSGSQFDFLDLRNTSTATVIMLVIFVTLLILLVLLCRRRKNQQQQPPPTTAMVPFQQQPPLQPQLQPQLQSQPQPVMAQQPGVAYRAPASVVINIEGEEMLNMARVAAKMFSKQRDVPLLKGTRPFASGSSPIPSTKKNEDSWNKVMAPLDNANNNSVKSD